MFQILIYLLFNPLHHPFIASSLFIKGFFQFFNSNFSQSWFSLILLVMGLSLTLLSLLINMTQQYFSFPYICLFLCIFFLSLCFYNANSLLCLNFLSQSFISWLQIFNKSPSCSWLPNLYPHCTLFSLGSIPTSQWCDALAWTRVKLNLPQHKPSSYPFVMAMSPRLKVFFSFLSYLGASFFFLSFFKPHLRTCLQRERVKEEGRQREERRKGGERNIWVQEKHWFVAFFACSNRDWTHNLG